MIIASNGLAQLHGRVTMADGGFDPLHAGHLEYFEAAAALGCPLLCNIAPDEYVARKHPPLLRSADRARLIDALRPVSYTHAASGPTSDVLRELRPRYYVKGAEWRDRLPQQELDVCAANGIEPVYLDTKRDSSSAIITRLITQIDGCASAPDGAAVARFEELVLAQRAIGSEHYDAEYFVTGWRQAGNCYELETRRRIEGRHPALIKEVFEPRRVLDLGCGPGALMYLLEELGIHADGVDFAGASRDLAPPEVRDRITIAPVTDPGVEAEAYDLAICREVLEHLTVLQVRRTIGALCRASSRFVYITTRFHPDPADLLDVTTQFEVDPSHITLLNKDLLRTLIVLEGFRRRDDLERRMDWGGKDRVLVYERCRP